MKKNKFDINKCLTMVTFKEGQKKQTPPPHDSLRKFYTSLLKQDKHSQIALKWCLEHGLLPPKKINYALMCLNMQKLSIKENKNKLVKCSK